MSMLCRPMWPFLLMYGSHDMRHTSFSQVDGGQWDPRGMGRHTFIHLLGSSLVQWKIVRVNGREEPKQE